MKKGISFTPSLASKKHRPQATKVPSLAKKMEIFAADVANWHAIALEGQEGNFFKLGWSACYAHAQCKEHGT